MKRLAFLALLALAACSDKPSDTIQGYGEAQYLYVASQDGGPLTNVLVKEGDHVSAGAVLFRTDKTRLQLSLDSAVAAEAAARARTDPNGPLAEAVRQAEANAELARKNLERSANLVKAGTVSKAQLDADEAAVKTAEAALAQAKAERDAATTDLGTAVAATALARQHVADTEGKAPDAGTVQRIYRRAGEVLAPAVPVLALLPDANMKIRFYVPEPQLARFAVGTKIALTCDGCAAGLTAHVTFVASDPQFTPPVIYSLEERDKLVFLAEALPDQPNTIRPGLPVDIALAP